MPNLSVRWSFVVESRLEYYQVIAIDEVHQAVFVGDPDLARCMLSRRRSALAGTRSKYAVSSSAAYSSVDTARHCPGVR